MEKWRNVELHRRFVVDGLTNYLIVDGIKYEISDCGVDGIFGRHFEIFCDDETQERIDTMIGWLMFWDAHYEDYSE